MHLEAQQWDKITHTSTLTGKTAVTDHHHRNTLAQAHWTPNGQTDWSQFQCFFIWINNVTFDQTKTRKHHGFYFERILSYYLLFPVLFWSLKDFLSESDNHLRLKINFSLKYLNFLLLFTLNLTFFSPCLSALWLWEPWVPISAQWLQQCHHFQSICTRKAMISIGRSCAIRGGCRCWAVSGSSSARSSVRPDRRTDRNWSGEKRSSRFTWKHNKNKIKSYNLLMSF